jgi:hypothetical protein
MFKSLWEILESGYYSLPAQLLVMQVRYQKYVLACWIFFFLATTNNFGEMLGVPYLFLEPEYLGHISFTSMFLLGCGIGTFIASYMISTYVSDSFRFHFLAIEKTAISGLFSEQFDHSSRIFGGLFGQFYPVSEI